MNFSEIVSSRYATKKFDGKKIPEADVEKLLDLIRLAPSSSNFQPWKIVVVTDPALKGQLRAAAYGQEQLTSSSHVLVFCADTRLEKNIEEIEAQMTFSGAPKESVEGYVAYLRSAAGRLQGGARLAWAQRQVYLALGNALNGAKSLGFDSCPMEGFVPAEFSKILGLPEYIVPTAICPIGYAADVPRKKSRLPLSSIVIRKDAADTVPDAVAATA